MIIRLSRYLKVLTVLGFFLSISYSISSEIEWQPVEKEDIEKLTSVIQTRFQRVKSLVCRFKMVRTLSLLEETFDSEGVFAFYSPGYLRFEILSPFQSVMFFTPKGASKYEKRGTNWVMIPTGKTEGLEFILKRMASWIEGEFIRFKDDIFIPSFWRYPKMEGGPIIQVRLIPNHPSMRSHLQLIVMTLFPDLSGVQEIFILDTQNDSLSLTFNEPKFNIDLPLDLFSKVELSPLNFLVSNITKENKIE